MKEIRLASILMILGLILLISVSAQHLTAACTYDPVIDPRTDQQDRDVTNGPMPVVGADDIIGYCADGNVVDPDDIAATPLALAILARQHWQHKLVHFSYNNFPMNPKEGKDEAHHTAAEVALELFGYDLQATQVFNLQADNQWSASVESAVNIILSTSAERHFYWLQAGPHEFAYQVLSQVAEVAPEKLQYVTLLSHAAVNNGASHPIRVGIQDGSECGRKLADVLELGDGLNYFYTSRQWGVQNFGGKQTDPSNWPAVEWMRSGDCAGWNHVYSSFKLARTFYDDDKGEGLDASDAGMAYTLVTGDPDGNFETFTSWVDGWCPSDAD